MTQVVSLVRLVPVRKEPDGSRVYFAQYKLPEDRRWETVGVLALCGGQYSWAPNSENLNFQSIEVSSRDLYADSESRFDPVLFARYKIRKFAQEILEDRWPTDTVVPPGFADQN